MLKVKSDKQTGVSSEPERESPSSKLVLQTSFALKLSTQKTKKQNREQNRASRDPNKLGTQTEILGNKKKNTDPVIKHWN